MHGLLHSGARYAVADPESARACIEENDVLRSIADHCIADTGGLFVEHPTDPPEYFERKRAACEECSIPIEELTGAEARQREPGLSEAVTRALWVPDGAVDPYRLTVANATSAQRHGADIWPNTNVMNILTDERGVRSAALIPNGTAGQSAMLEMDYIVNAAGAWAGEVAALADLDVSIRPSKGALAATDIDASTVLNRCRPKDEGDILVPHDGGAVLGATDVPVDTPDGFSEDDAEIDLLFDELAPIFPELKNVTASETFWGVRPLYDPDPSNSAEESDPGAITRGFSLIDHEQRDDFWGMSTIVGGKFTTHRLMAEAVADHVCEKFGIDRDCETGTEPLPGGEDTDPLETFDTDPPIDEWDRR
jgi:glycerol-3-phosphate dehydrogenase